MSEKLLEEIRKRLNAKTIHDLRQIARAVGVPRPADGRKERILEDIMLVASGENDPVAPSVRGAHPKSDLYDRQLVADIFHCREINLSNTENVRNCDKLILGSGVKFDELDFTAEGFLEKSDGKWFMHVNGCTENIIGDVYVNEYFVNNFKLREGDLVSGRCKRSSKDELAGLASVTEVNHCPPQAVLNRLKFEDLAPVYPNKMLKAERSHNDFTGRLTDLISPIGAGQRALVIGPHGSGKTSILKDLAQGLIKNNSITPVFLLIDSSPEESAEYNSLFQGCYIFSSPFDMSVVNHVRTAKLALEFAKRQAECGKDVVLFVDDLTRLALAYNACGRQIASALDISALENVKKFLASAHNTSAGASLTIISALSTGEGDAVEQAIYSGLSNVCNMRIMLSSRYVRKREYPPVDIENTRSLGDEKLLSEKQLKASVKLREEDLQKIFTLFAQTKDNNELCEILLR